MERVSKDNYYLDIAQTVAERGTCLRRLFGAIIVKTTLLFQQAMQVHQEEDKTAVI